MHLVTIGKHTFNLDNVSEIVDYGDFLAVCFLAAWPNPEPNGEYATHISSRNLTGDDAEAMRRYVRSLADDATARLR